MERFASLGAADASERLQNHLLRQTALAGVEYQVVNRQHTSDVTRRIDDGQTTYAKVAEPYERCFDRVVGRTGHNRRRHRVTYGELPGVLVAVGYRRGNISIGDQPYQAASVVYDGQTSAVVRRHHLGSLSELSVAVARSRRGRHRLADLHGCVLSVRRASITRRRMG